MRIFTFQSWDLHSGYPFKVGLGFFWTIFIPYAIGKELLLLTLQLGSSNNSGSSGVIDGVDCGW